jgi:alkanesulfonate monooxygenase SsuD/methylene tetrahydromethanopterin reductase-like flavin-dependent oxidoreductase (luciferase family)
LGRCPPPRRSTASSPDFASPAYRRRSRGIPITGTPAEAAERFHQYAEAGADHLILGVIGDDWRHQYERIAEARALAGQA